MAGKSKYKVEYRSPADPDTGKPHKTLFWWTTPEMSSADAARDAAKQRAMSTGYTVRAASIRRATGGTQDVVVYVTKESK